MPQFNKEELLIQLKYFTGSELFYRAALFKNHVYTEGVRFLAQEAECYWLIDFILARQISPELKYQGFQTWSISCKDSRAVIKVTDGDEKHIYDYMIPYSDFHLEEFTLWLIDKTLMLPSEY